MSQGPSRTGSNPEQETAAQNIAVINGAVEIEITYRTGQRERVKVRSLPIRVLTTEWPRVIGDEAALVELYCDKRDPKAWEELRQLQTEEWGLVQLLAKPTDAKQVQSVSGDLAVVRNKIDKLKKETSWDDQLIPESHDEIIRIGDSINRPRFDRWIADRHESLGHLKDIYREHLPEHPLVKGDEAPAKGDRQPASSSSSPTPVSH